jgi:Zn ribbon nucleic-acid-binding protein
MGDHAIVPHQTTERPGNDLEQGSLYIIDSDAKWHLLRPFLVGQDCPICKNWSTFHADREKRVLVIKSLEHGHIGDGSSLAEPLRQVGLL